MEWIGFFACFFIWLMTSAFWCVCASIGLGRYNIGGDANTWRGRGLILLTGLAILIGWWALFHFSPFTLIANKT